MGQWLPSDRQALPRWLDDLTATVEARGETPLLPVIEKFGQLIEHDPEIYMLFSSMLSQVPYLTSAHEPQVKTVDRKRRLFNRALGRPGRVSVGHRARPRCSVAADAPHRMQGASSLLLSRVRDPSGVP